MLMILCISIGVALGSFVVTVITKQPHNWKNYILYFFVMFIVSYLCLHSRLHATECRISSAIEIERIQLSFYSKALNKADRMHFEEKLKFHKENAIRTYQDAKDKCWYLPRRTDRDNAKTCYRTALALIVPGSPQSKLVITVVNLLTDYGIDCLEEWEYINTKLHWSQYHYEMAEFYQNLLDGKRV